MATVTALSPIRLWALSGDEFRNVLATDPAAMAAWRQSTEMLLRCRLLKRASPFASLPPAAARALAASLAAREVARGAVILRQGDPGDECYLMVEGEVAVVTAKERRTNANWLGSVPESCSAEMALLSGAPRSASVRATKDCRLLALGRVALKQAMAADRHVASQVLNLFYVVIGPVGRRE